MRFLKSFILFLAINIVLLFLFIPMGVKEQFGNISIDSIMFHIYMPKKGMSWDWMVLSLPTVIFVFIFSILFCFAFFRYKKLRKIFVIFILCQFIFDIYYIDSCFSLWRYIVNQYNASDLIEKEYINPRDTSISFPLKKKNLVFIQVESLESSMQDVKSGGLLDVNYIPELTELAKQNINFSSSDLVGGAIVLPETGWTMGGLVAETAGIPLKSYKIHKRFDQVGNHFNKYNSFLANVVSLGDILKSSGYKNYFILGTSKMFAGQDIYMKNHGNHEIYDYEFIKNDMKVNKPSEDWWGLLDKDVFDFSKKKLKEISKNDEPFSVVIQTVDTHREGVLSPECSPKYDALIKNVYSCVSQQLNDFILWLKKQEFFLDTVVVVVGDHCNMSREVFNMDISRETGLYEGVQRKVYNVFINSQVEPSLEKNRLFSTMDIFPTTLAALGAEIQGNRLGLGTNLFSDQKTLLEKYGYDFLYQELRKKSNFYNHKLLYPN